MWTYIEHSLEYCSALLNKKQNKGTLFIRFVGIWLIPKHLGLNTIAHSFFFLWIAMTNTMML